MGQVLEPLATAEDAALASANDPLPEASWFWRRTFAFCITVALLFGAYVGVGHLGYSASTGSETAIDGLVSVTQISLFLVGLIILFYMLAPSAEQLTKLVQTGLALRQGITFRSTAAAVDAHGGKAQVTTEAGSDLTPPKTVEAPTWASDETELPDNKSGKLPWESEPKT